MLIERHTHNKWKEMENRMRSTIFTSFCMIFIIWLLILLSLMLHAAIDTSFCCERIVCGLQRSCAINASIEQQTELCAHKLFFLLLLQRSIAIFCSLTFATE